MHQIDRVAGKVLRCVRKAFQSWPCTLCCQDDQLVVIRRAGQIVPVFSAVDGELLTRLKLGDIDLLAGGWAVSFAWGSATPVDANLRRCGATRTLPIGHSAVAVGSRVFAVAAETSSAVVIIEVSADGISPSRTQEFPQARRTSPLGNAIGVDLHDPEWRVRSGPNIGLLELLGVDAAGDLVARTATDLVWLDVDRLEPKRSMPLGVPYVLTAALIGRRAVAVLPRPYTGSLLVYEW